MSQPTSEFQVELELLELLEPNGSGIEVCHWYRLAGHAVGERTSSCTVAAAVSRVEVLLRYEGARRDPVLAGKPLESLYNELSLGLVMDFDVGFEPGKHWQRYARFQALPAATSSFEGWNAFVVENDEHARFIWMPPGRGVQACEVYLPLGAFETALRSFRRELEDHLRTRHSAPPVSGARGKLPAREAG